MSIKLNYIQYKWYVCIFWNEFVHIKFFSDGELLSFKQWRGSLFPCKLFVFLLGKTHVHFKFCTYILFTFYNSNYPHVNVLCVNLKFGRKVCTIYQEPNFMKNLFNFIPPNLSTIYNEKRSCLNHRMMFIITIESDLLKMLRLTHLVLFENRKEPTSCCHNSLVSRIDFFKI